MLVWTGPLCVDSISFAMAGPERDYLPTVISTASPVGALTSLWHPKWRIGTDFGLSVQVAVAATMAALFYAAERGRIEDRG